MKQARYSRYSVLVASAALINTLTICASAQSGPVALPLPAPTTSPAGIPTSDPSQEPVALPAADPVQATPSVSEQTTVPPGNQAAADTPAPGFVLSVSQSSQRLAERTRRILALRRLLQLNFNTAEFSRALRLLERLRDIRTAPPADPEKAMEAEYRELLAARPNDPLPPSSAAKIMDAARFYREEQTKIWSEMTREIGAERAEGLRNLVGQGESTRSSRVASKILYDRDGKIIESYTVAADTATGSRPVPILGDIPLIAPLFRSDTSVAASGGSSIWAGGDTVPAAKDKRSSKRGRRPAADNPPKPEPTTFPAPVGAGAPPEDIAVSQANTAVRSPGGVETAPGGVSVASSPNTSPFQQPSVKPSLSGRQTGSRSPYTPQPSVPITYSPTTVRLNLDEMIDLMREKIKAMNGTNVTIRP